MASPNLRSRTNATLDDQNGTPNSISTETQKSTASDKRHPHTAITDEGPNRLSVLDILRILGGLVLLSSTLSYFITGNSITWNYRPAFTRPARIKAWLRGPLNLTDVQLSAYNGTDPELPILVALNGSIYDVSASPHLYGPGGSYSFFAGRDATRAFVTGCFQEDLTGDMRGVEEMFVPSDSDLATGSVDLTREEKRDRKLRREREVRLAKKQVQDTVNGWKKMFDGGKDGKYFRVGRVNRGPGSGWEGWGERRELCAKAREGRPRRRAEDVA